MLRSGQHLVLTVGAIVLLLLTLANIALFVSNRSLQQDLNSRGQYIQETVQLQNLYQEMVKALADLSVRKNDPQLKELLSKHGITVNVETPPAAPPAPPAAAPKGGR